MIRRLSLRSALTAFAALVATTVGGSADAGLPKQGPYDLGIYEPGTCDPVEDGSAGKVTWVYALENVTLAAHSTEIVGHNSAGVTHKFVRVGNTWIYTAMPSFWAAVMLEDAAGQEWSEVARIRFRHLGVDASTNRMDFLGGTFASNSDVHLYEFEVELDGLWKPLFDRGIALHGTFHPDGYYDADYGVTVAGTRSPISKCVRGLGYKPFEQYFGVTYHRELLPACVLAMAADYCGEGLVDDPNTFRGTTVDISDRWFVSPAADIDGEWQAAGIDPADVSSEAVFDEDHAVNLSSSRYYKLPSGPIPPPDPYGPAVYACPAGLDDIFYVDESELEPMVMGGDPDVTIVDRSILIRSDPAPADWALEDPNWCSSPCPATNPFC